MNARQVLQRRGTEATATVEGVEQVIGHAGVQEWILVLAIMWTTYAAFSIIAVRNAHGLQKESEISFSSVSITWMGSPWVSASR